MNNQQITKIINYFRMNHDFHSPYTFIIDGNFLKLLAEKDINLEEKLKSILTGKIKIRVTACTLTELEMLGHEFFIILKKAKEMQVLKCPHTFQSVDRCILDHTFKEPNLIVCSQDLALRRRIRNKNVGIMYVGPDQRITMEDIERHQLLNTKEAAKQKFLPGEGEKKQIQEFREQQEVLEKLKQRKEEFKVASKRGVELKFIKKKIVKAPNPLSIKKKEDKHHHDVFKNEGLSNNNDEGQKTKRIRKRNKNKSSSHPDGEQ